MDIPERTLVNIRAWESRKPDLEHQLTMLLGGVPWTVDVDPLVILDDAPSDSVRARLCDCITNYVQGALYQLGRFVAEHGAAGVRRLNKAAHKHTLGLRTFVPEEKDDDNDNNRPCCTCAITSDGPLVVMISAPHMGLNPVDALAPMVLEQALVVAGHGPPVEAHVAPGSVAIIASESAVITSEHVAPSGAAHAPVLVQDMEMEMATRESILTQYDAFVGAVQTSVAKDLHLPTGAIVFSPNFLQTYQALLAVKNAADATGRPTRLRARDAAPSAASHWPLSFPMPRPRPLLPTSWETRLGALVMAYFRSVAQCMKTPFIEMLRHGFLEKVWQRRIAFRLVEDVPNGQHSEVTVEDGVLYVQTTVRSFGQNTGRAASGLMSVLV